jgi:hypothetical protein
MTQRGRNYTRLAEEYPIEDIDPHVIFDEDTHRYTVRGELVPRSATKVVSDALAEEPFDGNAIILKNMASWRARPRSKYGAMIRGLSDDEAAFKIKDQWSNANVLGTALHRRLEAALNDATEPDDGATDLEWRAVQTELEKLQKMGWVPRRTELSMWWERESDHRVACAGQLDALFTDANDELVLVDLKRTDHDLSAGNVPFGEKTGAPPMERFYANDFIKYSLQQSIYAVMFHQRTGLEIAPGRRFLLQAHPSMPGAVWTQCRCLDDEARGLLNALE